MVNNNFKLSIREAQDQFSAAKRTAQSLFKIIQFLFHRVPQQDRQKFFNKLRGKIINLGPGEIGIKQMPASSAIGQSVGIAKNLLTGLNPVFIKHVLIELTHLLSNVGFNYGRF